MTGNQTAQVDGGPLPGPGKGVSLDMVDPGLRLGRAGGWLRDHALNALRLLAESGEVRARVVGDAEMAAAHAKYRGDPTTTDVLTFDLNDAPVRPDDAADAGHPSGRVLDADILVCADEAGRTAAALGHTPERELLLCIIHGVLHCLGHDDADPVAAARMHAVEDRVLEALGVGATYAPKPAPGGPP